MPKEPEADQFVGCILYKAANPVHVLLVQPVGKSRKKWAIPEVEVSSEEDMAKAVRHEVADETGLKVNEVDYLGHVDYPRGRLHCFFGKVNKNARPERGHLEVREVQFFPLNEARDLVDKRQLKLLDALASALVFRESA